jgi:hypothetical protein
MADQENAVAGKRRRLFGGPVPVDAAAPALGGSSGGALSTIAALRDTAVSMDDFREMRRQCEEAKAQLALLKVRPPHALAPRCAL